MTMPSQYPSGPPNQNLGQRMTSARQRAKDGTGGRAAQVIGAHLEPGEQMLAGARVHTGPSDWLRWAPYIRLVVRLMQRHFYLMVTDRRLIFCGISYWSARPTHIEWVVPRAGVQASDYTAGAVYPSFRLTFPDRKPMRLRIYSSYEPEAIRILSILGMQIPGQAAGYGPTAATPVRGPAGYQPQQGYQPPQQQGYQPQPQQGYQPPPQGYQPYDAPTQYQAPPQGYQPAPPPQHYQGQQYQQPQQGYQSGPYEAPTQYQNPDSGSGSGSGRHRGS
jgi:hypothetical protein